MIHQTHPLPVRRTMATAEPGPLDRLLPATPVSETTLALMRRIVELHLQYPFAGARIAHVVRSATARGPRYWAASQGHSDAPHGDGEPCFSVGGVGPFKSTLYPSRDLAILKASHVWQLILPTFRWRQDFAYLFAVLGWASHRVLAWQLSNTLTRDFCFDAVREAITQHV